MIFGLSLSRKKKQSETGGVSEQLPIISRACSPSEAVASGTGAMEERQAKWWKQSDRWHTREGKPPKTREEVTSLNFTAVMGQIEML